MKIPEDFSRRICAFFLASIIAALTGCSTVGTPGRKEAAAIEGNKKALLLVRISYVGEDATVARPTSEFSITLSRLGNVYGRIEPVSRRAGSPFKGLSDATAKQGWGYVLVEPGTYCVEIAPTDMNSRMMPSDRAPVYYLSVPAEKRLVYGGTLVFNRKWLKSGHNSSAFKEIEFTLSDFLDETEEARKTVGKELAENGAIESNLLPASEHPSRRRPGARLT